MDILLDTRMIGHSGIGTYLSGLLEGLGGRFRNRLTLLGNPQYLNHFGYPVVPSDAPVYGLKEQWQIRSLVNRLSPRLYHVPHFNAPLCLQPKLVVTIHDIIHLLYPQFSRRRMAYFYADFMIRRLSKRADAVITDSESTRGDLLQRGFSKDKTVTIPLAAGSDFRPVDQGRIGTVLLKYGLKPGYILYVGNIRKIKNVEGIIQAYKKLLRQNKFVAPLVLVGENQMAGLQVETEVPIHWLGKVVAEDLAAIYCASGVFVFPSFYEGFGLPPLEAMQCGCPVIVSNRGSLPEVVGEAGACVDPLDVEGLANTISRVLTDSELRKEMIRKGIERARKFAWKRTALETFDLYEKVLSSA